MGKPGTRLPANLLPGMASLGFLDARGEQDWGLEPHHNEGIEIVFLETGAMGSRVEARRFPLKAGGVTLTRLWQIHCLGEPNLGPGRLHWALLDVGIRHPRQRWKWPSWVMLSAAEKRELARRLSQDERPMWSGTPALQLTFRHLAACIGSFDPKTSATTLTLLVNQLLVNLLDMLRAQCHGPAPTRASHPRSVETFLAGLRDDPTVSAKTWTLAKMAGQCGLGTTTFSRRSHAIVNMSPWEYLIRCRLTMAAYRLRQEPAKSITAIAFACGFNSSQYFATRFRKRFGCTPRESRPRST
jgi:AraC family L-rhamnose operon regulatory protein RhaS